MRQIAISDHRASQEWPFEIADESGQTVLALPIGAVITPLAPEPDEDVWPDQLSAENDG